MYKGFKRAADIVLSLIALTVLAPLLLAIAWLIRLDSPGGSIFSQQRIGKAGRPFQIYKFRTMYTQAPPDAPSAERAAVERYITPLGRRLRQTSLDELPQLWNVLKGDMSLVGPRPVVSTETELLRLRRQSGALQVRPGLTGLAQVSGREKLSPSEKARYDAQYVRHLSLRQDLGILLATGRCLFHGV